jgi:F-type H+-transporting ATPase subunit b
MSALALATPAHAAGDLVLIPSLPLLVALVVLFAVLVLPVNAMVFKPVFRILDEREARTTGTREKAEQLERDAQEILDRYESSVQGVRDEAERERRAALEGARGDSQGATADARAAAESEIEQARAQIHAEFEAARTALRNQSQDLARQAASRVLGRVL